MAEQFIFFAAATIAIITAVFVVTGRNLFHASMFLGLHLLFISAFYFLLSADLIGIMQVFVYVGGVIVVLLFGVMLTSQLTNVRLVSALEQRGLVLAAVGALVMLMAFVIIDTGFDVSKATPTEDGISLIGKLFMTNYILPFEVISILLLAALIGAVVVARQEGKA